MPVSESGERVREDLERREQSDRTRAFVEWCLDRAAAREHDAWRRAEACFFWALVGWGLFASAAAVLVFG